MTSRQLGIMGFVLAVLAAAGSVVVVLAATSVQYGKLLSTVEQTQKDVSEIKATLGQLAPPTIKHASEPAAQPAAPAAVVVQPAPPADEPAEPLPEWHRAYVRDHCRLCPSCCATAATGDL